MNLKILDYAHLKIIFFYPLPLSPEFLIYLASIDTENPFLIFIHTDRTSSNMLIITSFLSLQNGNRARLCRFGASVFEPENLARPNEFRRVSVSPG